MEDFDLNTGSPRLQFLIKLALGVLVVVGLILVYIGTAKAIVWLIAVGATAAAVGGGLGLLFIALGFMHGAFVPEIPPQDVWHAGQSRRDEPFGDGFGDVGGGGGD